MQQFTIDYFDLHSVNTVQVTYNFSIYLPSLINEIDSEESVNKPDQCIRTTYNTDFLVHRRKFEFVKLVSRYITVI